MSEAIKIPNALQEFEAICNNRKDCLMRHENGNCLMIGGFCTAVSDTICTAVQQAYEKGYRSGYYKCWQELYTIGSTNEPLVEDQ